MRITRWFVLLMLVAPLTASATATRSMLRTSVDDPSPRVHAAPAEPSVLDQQQAMATAIMQQDWRRLETMLDDECTYIHSFGRVDSRREFLSNIAKFPAVPQWVHRNARVVMLAEGVALVYSELHVTLGLPDGAQDVSTQLSTEVWRRSAGAWRLLSHQSTGLH